jgi:DNA mismatch repair ATPase MutL
VSTARNKRGRTLRTSRRLKERMESRKIEVLSEIEVNRLTAAVVVPRFADVYLGLLQNCKYSFFEKLLMRGMDAKATSIEAFIDIANGRITVIDNGHGMTPDTLTQILNSTGSYSFHIC